jgi:hypothetical protein
VTSRFWERENLENLGCSSPGLEDDLLTREGGWASFSVPRGNVINEQWSTE